MAVWMNNGFGGDGSAKTEEEPKMTQKGSSNVISKDGMEYACLGDAGWWWRISTGCLSSFNVARL